MIGVAIQASSVSGWVVSMNFQKPFRALLLVSLVAMIVAAVLGATASNYVSADWKTLLEWDGNGGLIDRIPDEFPSEWGARVLLIVGVIVAIGFGLFTLVAQIGMFFFWRFARPGFLVVTVVWIAMIPFFGLSVTLPLEGMLYYAATLCDGAALAMAYFSPLSERFIGVRTACGPARCV